MSIRIDPNLCVGCGACIEACPGNLIKRNSRGKAILKRPEECWGCASCLKECRFKAASYYLGADIGGQGALMQVEKEGDVAHWIIRIVGRAPIDILVDRRCANRY